MEELKKKTPALIKSNEAQTQEISGINRQKKTMGPQCASRRTGPWRAPQIPATETVLQLFCC